MRSLFLLPASLLLLAVASFGQTASQPVVNLDTIDKTVDPCVDFYQYACGNWLKTAVIPPDQTSWVSFVEIRERNSAVMREILEKASAASAGRDAISQKIGDYYGSCIDETAVDAKGVTPLTPELKRIATAKDKAALIEAVARVQLLGPNPLFNFYSSPDLHNASDVIAYIDQGGLSLPDRDYYLKDDPKMAAARTSLVEYATQLFTLSGQSAEAGCGFGAVRVAHRDRPGQSCHGPHRAPRSQNPRSQDDPRRGHRPGAQFPSGSLLCRHGYAEVFRV